MNEYTTKFIEPIFHFGTNSFLIPTTCQVHTILPKTLYALIPFSVEVLKPTQPAVTGERPGRCSHKADAVPREGSSLSLRTFSRPGTRSISLNPEDTPYKWVLLFLSKLRNLRPEVIS